MKKRILLITFIVISLISIITIGYVGTLIFSQYQSTKHWDSSELVKEIQNLPPAFASNYISLEDEELLQKLADVNFALQKIQEVGGIPEDELQNMYTIYTRALTLEEQNIDTNNEIMAPTHRLGLYIEIERALLTAYSDPNPEPLNDVSHQLASFILDGPTPTDTLYSERLQVVANDYVALQELSSKAIATLGVIDNKVLTLDIDVNREITTSLLSLINTNDLTRFSHVNSLKSLLESQNWNTLLEKNSSQRQFQKWEANRTILESLMKVDYIPIDNLKTYQQVIQYDSSLAYDEPEGYIIDPQSSVTSIKYGNRTLKPGQYVRRGTQLTFAIDMKYIPINQPTETPTEQPTETPTETPIITEDNNE